MAHYGSHSEPFMVLRVRSVIMNEFEYFGTIIIIALVLGIGTVLYHSFDWKKN